MSCNYYGQHQRNQVQGNSMELDHLTSLVLCAHARMNRRHREHMSMSESSACRAWSYTSSMGPFATATHSPFCVMFSQNCTISISKCHLVCHASHLFCSEKDRVQFWDHQYRVTRGLSTIFILENCDWTSSWSSSALTRWLLNCLDYLVNLSTCWPRPWPRPIKI